MNKLKKKTFFLTLFVILFGISLSTTLSTDKPVLAEEETTPTLARTESGLILRDDFDLDVMSFYHATRTTSMEIVNGELAVYGINYMTRDNTYGTMCITSRSHRNGGSSPIMILTPDNEFSIGETVTGYGAMWSQVYRGFRMTKFENGSKSMYDLVVELSHDWYLERIMYRGDGNLRGVYGTGLGEAFLYTIDVQDSVYSPPFFGAMSSSASAGGSFDWVEYRTSHLITINDLPPGYYVQASDGTTTAKSEESDGTAIIDAGSVLFPLASLSVYNGDPDNGGTLVDQLTATNYSDMGGGDVYNFDDTTSPTFSSLPGSTSPINVTEGQTITTNPYVIQVKPEDNIEIDYVEFYIDDNLICTDSEADDNGIYSCSWDTSKYHSLISVIAYDTTGNQSILLTRNTTVNLSVYGLRVLPRTGMR